MFDRADVAKSLLEAFVPRGSYKTWKATYIKLRKMNNLTLKVFTAAMFASPILGLLNMDGFALNVFGTTTNGKTTTMQMAASIWGDCSTKSDLIVSPKSTPTALELRLGVLKNLPLIVDDTAALTPEEKVEFQSTLMQMANGKCKDRGKKDLSLQEIFNWKTIIFFTSEGRIDKDWTTGGSKGRVVVLENEEKPEYFDDLDKYMEIFENNYGYAGRDFIEILQKIGLDKVRRMYIVRKTSEKEIGEWRVINGSPLIYQDNDGNEYTEEEASDKISELEEQIEEAESQADDLQEEMDKDIPDCNLQETEDKINELEGKIEHWKGAIETLQDGEVREVYQYYIVSKSAFETWLKGTGELVLYNDELDMYVWCMKCKFSYIDFITKF